MFNATLKSQNRMSSLYVHIDPVGGIAGDMFVAAMLDLFPELQADMLETVRCVSALDPVEVRVEPYHDSVLVGRRFSVSAPEIEPHHTHYEKLLSSICESSMIQEIKHVACQILRNLAHAEASVHGIRMAEVSLHEVGSLDSLTDIVCAAYLIHTAGVSSWYCAPLPAGNGTVSTAHGELSLPAPAVAELLRGYPVHNDGRWGERVTPTGAAIIRTINPQFDLSWQAMRLTGTGNGFGSATLKDLSNVLRLIAYEGMSGSTRKEKVAVIEFEIDDQSLEDLSIGLERLRGSHGVLDVIQIPAVGKKNRMAVHVQVLAQPDSVQEVVSNCALETATLGVRFHLSERIILRRRTHVHEAPARAVPLKVAERPGGRHTAKVEADHLRQMGDYAARKMVRQEAERQVEKKIQESKQ